MTQRNQFNLKGCLCKSIYYIPQNCAIPRALPHAMPQTRPLTLTRCICGDLPNQYRNLCRYELFRCVVLPYWRNRRRFCVFFPCRKCEQGISPPCQGFGWKKVRLNYNNWYSLFEMKVRLKRNTTLQFLGVIWNRNNNKLGMVENSVNLKLTYYTRSKSVW